MSDVAQIQSPPTEAADRPGRGTLRHPRPLICAVCTSRTRGFGWFDPNRPRGKRTYRWFCSMGCQAAFTQKARKGLNMVDFTEEEMMALPAVMRALAPEMERIGWDRPLGHLIPTCNDQNSCAHWRHPMEAMRSGWSISLFQASQQ